MTLHSSFGFCTRTLLLTALCGGGDCGLRVGSLIFGVELGICSGAIFGTGVLDLEVLSAILYPSKTSF
jgi:hypothetical protein